MIRALLAFVVLAATPVHGLALLDRDARPEGLHVRLAVDGGDVEARVHTGTVAIDGAAWHPSWRLLEAPVEPWLGYPRTLALTIAGNGTLLVADDAGALAIVVEPRPSQEESTAEPSPDAPDTQQPTSVGGPSPARDAGMPRQRPLPPTLDEMEPDATEPRDMGILRGLWLPAGIACVAALAAWSRRRRR